MVMENVSYLFPRSAVVKPIFMVQPDHFHSGVQRLLTSRLPKGDTYPVTPKSNSKTPVPPILFPSL